MNEGFVMGAAGRLREREWCREQDLNLHSL